MTRLPEPVPVVWRPGLRRALRRFLAYMDRREAAKWARSWRSAYNAQWRIRYDHWWHEVGWREGAPPLEVKWAEMKRRGQV